MSTESPSSSQSSSPSDAFSTKSMENSLSSPSTPILHRPRPGYTFPSRPSSLYRSVSPWPSTSHSLMLLLFTILALFAGSARSVLISTFDNCLSDDIVRSPSHLQFHPLVVAAAFGTKRSDYLQITVWGNVTGKSTSDPGNRQRRDLRGSDGDSRPELGDWGRESDEGWPLLEARQEVTHAQNPNGSIVPDKPGTLNWGLANFRNPTFDSDVPYVTTGQIVHHDQSWPSLTTLQPRVQIASFTMPAGPLSFCPGPDNASALCPMASTVKFMSKSDAHNLTVLMKELPSFTWEHGFNSGYSFASIDTTFTIISGNSDKTVIGCIHVETTPMLGKSNDAALTWVPAGILALVALGTVLAAMLNPWVGTTDIFRWSSNYGMDEDMIRLVTPGFADCLQWLQFFVLSGSLSLSYPGFYQPVVSRVAWSALLFNTSFFSHNPISQQRWAGDGLYALDATAYGFERVAQAVGLQTVDDIWVCVMAFFGVVAIGTVVMPQVWFAGKWIVRRAMGREEGDLTNKNLPFTFGMLNRITYTYFLAPVLAASTFVLTTPGRGSNTIVALAAALVFVIIAIAVLLAIRIWSHKPRSTLFDNLPTLLTFGTFYNTYREKNLKFFIVQLFVNISRAIAFGALQPSGIAQITILAICEIVLILTVCGIKPYAPATSMNAWQTIFAVVRLLTILLMMAFVPSMDAQDAAKSWIGYVILVIHAMVLIFGFFFMAVQTLLELFIRGCGGADEGAARGGLAKVSVKKLCTHSPNLPGRDEVISGLVEPAPNQLYPQPPRLDLERIKSFSGDWTKLLISMFIAIVTGCFHVLSFVLLVFGMRQLSRRKHKQHRSSVDPSIINVSTHVERKGSSTTNGRPTGVGPRSRSGSSAVLLGGQGVHTGAPGMTDVGNQPNHHHSGSGSTGYTPTTPGTASNFSYVGVTAGPPLVLDTGVTTAADPYYRPPRAKGGTYGPGNLGGGSGSDNYSPGERSGGSWGSGLWGATDATGGVQRSSQGSLPNGPDDLWNQGSGHASGAGTPQGAAEISQGGVPGPLAHRHTDSSLTAGSVRNTAPTDYTTREMDYYYGVRGPALNHQPGRRLGTGPADPTGPVAVTKGWLWKRLGWGFRGKKETGFTVVRSSRAPEELLDAERAAKGIGMAITSQTPPAPDQSDSSGSEDDTGDEEEAGRRSRRQRRRRKTPSPMSHLTGRSNGRRKSLSLISQNTDSDSEGGEGGEAAGPSSRMLEKKPVAVYDGSNNIELRHQDSIKPQVPRKSSKRKSVTYLTPMNSNPVVNQSPQPPFQRQQQQPVRSTSPPDSPIQTRLPHQPYDPPPLRPSLHPRHPQYDARNLTPAHHNRSTSGRLPFTTASPTHESQESTHTRSISTSSSLLPPPPEITADDNALSRPPSVGTVHRYRMEDSLRNSDVAEGGRSGSLVSEGGGGGGGGVWR
ncbi:hypothetical protein C7212DRAFT_360610 [Tuber magnatum]|uniref:ML-like domain-containing protein n=1 Tax=Tuber magnatum TaxID=42249 RepID=A0A317T063_9PEZI|nr:hypothetical protein C7212DRAFT_360610 [Tuber magnatum]